MTEFVVSAMILFGIGMLAPSFVPIKAKPIMAAIGIVGLVQMIVAIGFKYYAQ